MTASLARALAASAITTCAACGGSLANAPSGDDAGDATTAVDASRDASDAAPAHDAASRDAATIACGAAECRPPQEVCCPEVDGGTCVPAGDGAAPCGVPHDFEIACLHSTDCPTGQVCCFEFHHGCDFNAFCYASCAQSMTLGRASYQACRTGADCNDGGTCAAHVCQNGFSGIPVSTCTPPPSGCCP